MVANMQQCDRLLGRLAKALRHNTKGLRLGESDATLHRSITVNELRGVAAIPCLVDDSALYEDFVSVELNQARTHILSDRDREEESPTRTTLMETLFSPISLSTQDAPLLATPPATPDTCASVAPVDDDSNPSPCNDVSSPTLSPMRDRLAVFSSAQSPASETFAIDQAPQVFFGRQTTDGVSTSAEDAPPCTCGAVAPPSLHLLSPVKEGASSFSRREVSLQPEHGLTCAHHTRAALFSSEQSPISGPVGIDGILANLFASAPSTIHAAPESTTPPLEEQTRAIAAAAPLALDPEQGAPTSSTSSTIEIHPQPAQKPKLKISTGWSSSPVCVGVTSQSGPPAMALVKAVVFIHTPVPECEEPMGRRSSPLSASDVAVDAVSSRVPYSPPPPTLLTAGTGIASSDGDDTPSDSSFPEETDVTTPSECDACFATPNEVIEDPAKLDAGHMKHASPIPQERIRPAASHSINFRFDGADINIAGNGDIACGNTITINDCQDLLECLLLNNLPYARMASFDNLIDKTLRPACIEGTRTDLVQNISRWAHDSSAPRFFWLEGMAGTGKTTISQSLAEMLSSTGLLAASFFCTDRHDECTKVENIIPTIATLLARNSGAFATGLSAVLKRDPDAGIHSVARQFRDLLVTPFHSVPDYDRETFNQVVIIDALDECTSDDGIQELLRALSGCASHDIPLKFFVASHAIPFLQHHFQRERNMSQSVTLHEVPKPVISSDIEKYIRKTLLDVANEKHVDDSDCQWPPENEIGVLVRRADRLFIYAATVCRYVRKGYDVCGRLTDVTSDAFALRDTGLDTEPIDSLYRGILTKAFAICNEKEKQKLRLILSTIITLRDQLSLQTLASLLGLLVRNIRAPLSLLHSVIVVPSQPDGIISTFHHSFPDFLVNRRRSHEFCLNTEDSHRHLASRCLALLNNNLHKNLCQLAEQFPNLSIAVETIHGHIDEATCYAAVHWVSHLIDSGYPKALEFDMLLRTFINDHLLHWLECLSILRRLRVAQTSLASLENWVQDAELRKKISSASSLLASRYESISRSWSEVYSSNKPVHMHEIVDDYDLLSTAVDPMTALGYSAHPGRTPSLPGGFLLTWG